jgi:chaperonin GroES
MSIVPIGERVLIRPKKAEEKTRAGIFLPDSAQEKRKEGLVIGVGSYKDGGALPLVAGDYVIYGGYSAETIEQDGEDLVFVDFSDILAKVV